jgi:hypothetical protein
MQVDAKRNIDSLSAAYMESSEHDKTLTMIDAFLELRSDPGYMSKQVCFQSLLREKIFFFRKKEEEKTREEGQKEIL